MIRFNGKALAGLALAGLMAVAATAQAKTDTELVANAHATKTQFLKADPGLSTFFAHSPGYVVFPSIAKGAVGIGGAHGNGVVFQNDQPIGKASLSQISIGAQLGGQEYSEIIFFENPAALARFTQGKMEFSGQVSAVALKAGASADAKYRDGVAVFTATRGGLMLEASVGGQKFGYDAFTTR